MKINGIINNISCYRHMLLLSREYVARYLGVSDFILANVEAGTMILDDERMQMLANLFGASIDDLLLDTRQLPGNDTMSLHDRIILRDAKRILEKYHERCG